MNIYEFSKLMTATGTYARLVDDVIRAPVIHTGEWQAMDTRKSKAHATHELTDVTLWWPDAPWYPGLAPIPHIDTEWADKHFAERVGGEPLNPAPSHVDWPYAVRGNGDHTTGGKFDHTYPERFWPRFANEGNTRPNGRQVFVPHNGVRFEYGDLSNVVDLLVRSPLTRQAYLPVWFPEDTGAVDGQRVPCTLGYHFMVRDDKLSMRYYLRSCDVYRHLSNDVYLAMLLQQWVVDEVNKRSMQGEGGTRAVPAWDQEWTPVSLGSLSMHIASLHMFVGDKKAMQKRMDTA